jgi:hypothetical protein
MDLFQPVETGHHHRGWQELRHEGGGAARHHRHSGVVRGQNLEDVVGVVDEPGGGRVLDDRRERAVEVGADAGA